MRQLFVMQAVSLDRAIAPATVHRAQAQTALLDCTSGPPSGTFGGRRGPRAVASAE
jgi:hypothetical protein